MGLWASVAHDPSSTVPCPCPHVQGRRGLRGIFDLTHLIRRDVCVFLILSFLVCKVGMEVTLSLWLP
jgi:hypothetical protein